MDDRGYFVAPESPVKWKIDSSPRNGRSPRRVRCSPVRPPRTPPQWKRPDEVMRLHKMRRQSLTATFNEMKSPEKIQRVSTSGEPVKRKNPFKCPGKSPKVVRVDSPKKSPSLFRLLGLADPQAIHQDPLNFENIIEKIKEQNQLKVTLNFDKRSTLPVDWSLRSKLRFMSTKPFPWNQTLKTCEEASGITGFVRCMGGDSQGLDTSPNAMFHQCCLYWQYPCFPWLSLYPRKQDSLRRSQTDKNLPSFSSHPHVKETLHCEFIDSLRSVFQLLRARHCPYFYVVSNNFICLFRAAGINSSSEISAMVCPTTQGLRQSLRDNDIEFTLPLKRIVKKNCDLGEDYDLDEEDQGETNEWLTKLGVSGKDIDKISSPNESNLSNELDLDSRESLVYVDGCDVLSLFNFLINFRSAYASTGPLAGIPPTLLSPVAFSKACLSNLQVSESTVKEGSNSFYSIEICGPILPDTIHNLCDILHESSHEFSVTFATDQNTKPFTSAVQLKGEQQNSENVANDGNAGSAFCVQNLNDSGMKESILPRFCSYDISLFDSVKFTNGLYNIS